MDNPDPVVPAFIFFGGIPVPMIPRESEIVPDPMTVDMELQAIARASMPDGECDHGVSLLEHCERCAQ